MNIKQFSIDSPLGMGWLTGHVALRDAVEALAEKTGQTVQQVKAKYQIKEDI